MDKGVRLLTYVEPLFHTFIELIIGEVVPHVEVRQKRICLRQSLKRSVQIPCDSTISRMTSYALHGKEQQRPYAGGNQ